MLWFIAYVIVNGILSLIVASFFDDKKIGFTGVFLISFLFTPLLGILLGIVSDKKQVVYQDAYPDERFDISPEERLKKAKLKLMSDIELLLKEKELGLLDEDGEQTLQSLKQRYSALKVDEISPSKTRKYVTRKDFTNEIIAARKVQEDEEAVKVFVKKQMRDKAIRNLILIVTVAVIVAVSIYSEINS